MGKLKLINKYTFLIISAGINKRFKMRGFDKPKSLLEIKGESLIEVLLKNLKKSGVKKIHIIVGFKYKIIKNHISKLKKIPKIKYIKINNFKKYGSGYSIYKFQKEWEKNKKPLVMMHSDLYCDWSYFKDILNNKFDNVIGTTNFNSKNFKKSFLVVSASKKKITKINYFNNLNKYYGQISCINKFSKNTTKEIFKFMDNYFLIEKNKSKTWELIINDLIKFNSKLNFFVSKKNYKNWYNINKIKDYLIIKKI